MSAIKKITGWIPNSITCCNLLSGCLACIFAFRVYETIGALRGWQWTCVFIGAAAVFDFLDGAMARLLKAYSKLGAELDSLSDLVSFGVAPAFLIFNIMGHFSAEADAQTTWLQYAALAVPVLGALRLARFNVMDVGDVNFHGLPIPSAAIFLIGVAGWINDYYYPGNIIIAVLTVLIAVAMVGRFRRGLHRHVRPGRIRVDNHLLLPAQRPLAPQNLTGDPRLRAPDTHPNPQH